MLKISSEQSNYPIPTKDISIDGVGVFDGVYSTQLCKNLIEYFNIREKSGYADIRKKSQNISEAEAFDKVLYLDYGGFYSDSEMRVHSQEFLDLFWSQCYKPYADKFFALKSYNEHKIYHMKIQKTSFAEGFHVWHADSAKREICNRILVFILYLNDVEQGGETEFLYQGKRISPKTGRLVIWPAGFTHTHRGNPPISGDKYVLTGWVEF